VFLAERWDNKEVASGLGALSQVTERVKLVAGLTHFGTRHPLVLAGMAASLQNLSKGRFTARNWARRAFRLDPVGDSGRQ
jgi:alkanesulfonate monooxygenase SsuD/methylene tetrahydromethanopterin reductase-like flavin-dependent oxidoreductase (luciferase family)